MKKLTAILLIICLAVSVLPTFAYAADYDDASIMKLLSMLDVMVGDESGDFHLENKVTRAEFTKVAIMSSSYRNAVPENSTTSPFGDVPYTLWSAPYITLAVDSGMISGYPDSTFRPNNTVLLEEAVKLNDEELEIYPAAADEIFYDLDNLSEEAKSKLPLWNNELVMQNHAVGGYTSRVMSKRWNRHMEELGDMAERSSVLADFLGVNEYNKVSLTRAWKRAIAHQFHDDMPGTSCQRVYKRSWNDLFVSMNQFKNEMETSLSALTSHIDTSFCEGRAVVVYNSIELERNGVVTVRLTDFSSKYVRHLVN